MLITSKLNEMTYPSQLPGGNGQVWRVFDIKFNAPYFFVTHKTRSDRVWLSTTSILWRFEDLLELCNVVKASRSRKIDKIFLMAPSWMTGGSGWELKILEEVWLAQISQFESSTNVHLFVVAPSDALVNSSFNSEIKALKKLPLLLSVSKYS